MQGDLFGTARRRADRVVEFPLSDPSVHEDVEFGNSRPPQVRRTIRPVIRPVVQMLTNNKVKLYRDFERGVPERDLAKVYAIRREEVELVIFEVLTQLRPKAA